VPALRDKVGMGIALQSMFHARVVSIMRIVIEMSEQVSCQTDFESKMNRVIMKEMSMFRQM
jgi:hypothetical protein